MEDPTTLILNLTYLGTLGLAFLMFLGLAFLMVLTLVLAGAARLVSIILLAMVGMFPQRNTVPIVHLPPRPRRPPAPVLDPVPDDMSGTPATDVPAEAVARVSAPAGIPASGGSVPKEPASRKGSWVSAQTKHHPLLVAATSGPQLMSEKWAAAVEQANQREAARAKAAEPPKVVVTVREVDAPSTPAKQPPPPEAPPKTAVPRTVAPTTVAPALTAHDKDHRPAYKGTPTPASGARQHS